MTQLIVVPGLGAALRRAISVIAVSRGARVVALTAVIALGAVHVPHGAGTGTLVYVMHQDSDFWPQPYGLALMHPDGSSQVRLTSGTADTEPTWSPDGFSIAFSRSSDIYVIRAAGGTPVNLTNDPSRDSSPAWSPDGQRIAFVSNRGGPLELYLMKSDGSGVARLTGNLANTGRPAWAPDGSTIAFNCFIESGNPDICTVTADGSTVTRLTAEPGRDSDAAWSPDGGTIAFATERYGTITITGDFEEWLVAEIALMNPDGSGLRQLRDGAAAEYPSWSPDGARIAVEVALYFMYPLPPLIDVAVMNVDGTGPVSVAARGGSAAWRPAAGNLRPIAFFSAQCGAHTCAFDAASSVDPDGSIASYAWSFGDGTTGSGVTASHIYATGNPYTATLTISDDSGASVSVSYTVEPNNRPSAQFSVTCDGIACRFDGSTSSDADGTVVTYVWAFGDGSSAEGPIVTHTYSLPGLYPVTLRATDNEGAAGSRSRTAIAAAAPVAAFTFTCTRLVCTFDGSGSSDSDGTIVSYEWYFGDGSYGSGAIVSHVYENARAATVTLTVRDNLGLANSVHEWLWVSATLPPVASFAAECSNLTCAFDGSASLPTEGTITSYQWDFGDGSLGSGRTVSYTYQAPGAYAVVLTVRNSGASNTQRMDVTVTSGPAHVGDIDGVVSSQGALWKATVTIEVHGVNHARLANVRVSGSWSNGMDGECTTYPGGRCVVQLGGISKQTRSVSFSVTSVSDASSYRPDQNHDADGDSNGTTIIVKRP